jgi:hypothetical protein
MFYHHYRTPATLATSTPTQQTPHSPSTCRTTRCCSLSTDPSTPLPQQKRRSGRTSGQDTLRRTCSRITTLEHSSSPMPPLDTPRIQASSQSPATARAEQESKAQALLETLKRHSRWTVSEKEQSYLSFCCLGIPWTQLLIKPLLFSF